MSLYSNRNKVFRLLRQRAWYSTDENIESVMNYPIPRNSREIQRFIGLASYFRRFILNFSLIAKPLYDLIKKDVAFNYGTAENDAFETLNRH